MLSSTNFRETHIRWCVFSPYVCRALGCTDPAFRTQITKVGRYPTGFDYAPESIESSIARSLRRLHTTYIDVVYLHDVEFVADEKLAKRDGNHATALAGEREQYGLNEDQEGEAYSEKDEKVLAAVKKLFELRDERGIIKRVGISGKCDVLWARNLNSILKHASRIRLPASGSSASRDPHPETPWEASGPRDVILPPHLAEQHARAVQACIGIKGGSETSD
jgi:hypothetical protein